MFGETVTTVYNLDDLQSYINSIIAGINELEPRVKKIETQLNIEHKEEEEK